MITHDQDLKPHKSGLSSKDISFEAFSLLLAVLALTGPQLSYVCGGVPFLDIFLFFLVPAFLVMLWGILSSCMSETRDYCVSFTLVMGAVIFSLFFKSLFSVGTIDDDYHNLIIVSSSISNNFFMKLAIQPSEEGRVFFGGFIESLWGVFWRYCRWDHVIVVLQAMPIVLLWKQLVSFFRLKQVTDAPGFLAALVVLTLQVLWAQQGTTYIDSTVGILGGMVFLISYRIFHDSSCRDVWTLLGLGVISVLVIIGKTNLFLVGFFGVFVALSAAWHCLERRKIFFVISGVIPGLWYFFYHHYLVGVTKGDPFYPYSILSHQGNITRHFDLYHGPYEALRVMPIYKWLHNNYPDFQPFYVLASWVSDFRINIGVTADPWTGGNGLLWTYVVIPVLLMVLIADFKKYFSFKFWGDPKSLIFLLICSYTLFGPGSMMARMMVPFNIFILAWCLAWLWGKAGLLHKGAFYYVKIPLLGIMLVLAGLSYFRAISADMMIPSGLSMLSLQRHVFPQRIAPYKVSRAILAQRLRDQ